MRLWVPMLTRGAADLAFAGFFAGAAFAEDLKSAFTRILTVMRLI